MLVFAQVLVVSLMFAGTFYALMLDRDAYIQAIRDTRERFTWRMLAECVAVAIATLTVMVTLHASSPVLRVSWTGVAFGRTGNLGVTGFAHAAESAHAGPGWILAIGLGSLLLFLMVMPGVVVIEETIFRWQYIKTGTVAFRTVAFGLSHLIVGVSLGAACALMIPGAFYAYKYRRTFFQAREEKALPYTNEDDWHWSALKVSTAYHMVYNAFLVLMIALLFISEFLFPLP